MAETVTSLFGRHRIRGSRIGRSLRVGIARVGTLKRGGLDLVEVYGRLGDRVSGQASERLSEASTGSRPTWPAAAAGPVRRTLSRVGLGSIIRVIAGKRFGAKAAVCLGF